MAKGEVSEFDGFAWDSFFTTKEFMEKNPQTILSFTKAIIRAMDYIHNDKQGTVAVIAKTWKEATPELRQAAYETISKAVPQVPRLSKAGWEINMNLFFANASAEEKSKMSYQNTATNRFVDQALKEMGK